MHVALFGGTFNPIHYGHLRVAEEVREVIRAHKIVFIPTALTPHKAPQDITPAAIRLEMLELAISDNPGFEVSDIEVKRGGKSYTVDTVKSIQSAEKDIEVSLIIGADSFNEIGTWHRVEELMGLVNLIIVRRAGHPLSELQEVMPVELAKKFWYDAEKSVHVSPEGRTITYLPTTLMGVSASQIRRLVAAGRSIRYLVPSVIERYIAEKGLYTGPGDT